MFIQFHLPSMIEFVKYDNDPTVVETQVLTTYRPILKVKPTFTQELDSVVTMNIEGRYSRVSVLSIIIIDEKCRTAQKDFYHYYLSRAEDVKYHEEHGVYPLEFIPVGRDAIYEHIKGSTIQLIKDFYMPNKDTSDPRKYRFGYKSDGNLLTGYSRIFESMDNSISDERFYKHMNINKASVEEFEKKVAWTTEYIWNKTLLFNSGDEIHEI